MIQLIQNVKTGELKLEEVPQPTPAKDFVFVKTEVSIISAGTEKMLVELAQKSLVGKAQARPDLVRQVINKAKKEGWLNTFKNVQSKMEKPLPLGYSAAGTVSIPLSPFTKGGDTEGVLPVGTRVAVAGAGYANHAEYNLVPKNLCAVIPANISFEEAAYTTVASIALQGVRLAKPELGEYVAVSGLGLIGLITVQLLKANGCRVIGLDPDSSKRDLALKLGADAVANPSESDALRAVESFSNGRLADHTLITAAAKTNQPIEFAGEITRRKGEVIVIGAVGMNIPRDIYYKKEIGIKISMSYGPGRYDTSYEEGGIDYPYDYVRWTEQRNMEAVLDLMSRGKLDVKSLTTQRFKFNDALTAYEMIKKGEERYVGIVLDYTGRAPGKESSGQRSEVVTVRNVIPASETSQESKSYSGLHHNDKLIIGFIGAGNYASLHLLPHLKSHPDVKLKSLVTATGPGAKQKSEKFGFESCSTDPESLFSNKDINTIFIATRHSTHFDFVKRALESGKNVFVEKPVVINEMQLHELINVFNSAHLSSFNKEGDTEGVQVGNKSGVLTVGTNRRFSPMINKLKSEISSGSPVQINYRVNSGHVPASSWFYNQEEGGSMLVGEMCHFIDVMVFLTGEKPVSVFAKSLRQSSVSISGKDNISITIGFNSGSVGTLMYNTIGDKNYSKERIEVFTAGKVAVLDDFRLLEISSNGRKKKIKTRNQDKGQSEMISQIVDAFCKGHSPIPFNQITDVMKVVFAAEKSLFTSSVISLI